MAAILIEATAGSAIAVEDVCRDAEPVHPAQRVEARQAAIGREHHEPGEPARGPVEPSGPAAVACAIFDEKGTRST
jgi:hypothetical protein